MKNRNIIDKIDRLADLFADMLTDFEIFKVSSDKQKETEELISEIVDYLVWFPGALFYDKNQSRHKRNEKVVDLLWKMVDSEEIFDELLSGGYTGLLSHMLGDFSERVKMLKPTFISINPESTEFSTYFEEAMKAWLHGLPNAALIITFAVIEDLLKDRLCQKDISYVYELKDSKNPKGVKQVSYDRLIMSALNEEIIDKSEKNALFRIKKLRNDSIHRLETVTDSQVYDAIIETKKIVERLLSKT